MPQVSEDQIRQRAYELWEREGRPEGRQSAHWDQARREMEVQAGSQPVPPRGMTEPDTAKGGGAILPAARPGDSGKPQDMPERGTERTAPAPRRRGPARD